MSFFSRNKKKETTTHKKKWELQQEKSDSENSADEAATSIECTVCQGEPDLYCQEKTCKKYFCVRHFVAQHPLGSAGGDGGNGDAQAAESGGGGEEIESEMSKHRCRLLIGVVADNLSRFHTGWLTTEDKTQFQKKTDRDARRKRKREEEDQEQKARQKEDKLRKKDEEKQREEEEKLNDFSVAFVPQTPEECARHIVVKNIPPEAGLAEVRSMFRKAGRIIDVLVPILSPTSDKYLRRAKEHNGTVQIEFGDPKGASWAVAMDGGNLLGNKLQVMTVDQALDSSSDSSARGLTALKVKMCKYYDQGRCRRGLACNFAHSASELQGGKV